MVMKSDTTRLNQSLLMDLLGTGTPVGDPIEAYAIGNAFKRSRLGSDPLYM